MTHERIVEPSRQHLGEGPQRLVREAGEGIFEEEGLRAGGQRGGDDRGAPEVRRRRGELALEDGAFDAQAGERAFGHGPRGLARVAGEAGAPLGVRERRPLRRERRIEGRAGGAGVLDGRGRLDAAHEDGPAGHGENAARGLHEGAGRAEDEDVLAGRLEGEPVDRGCAGDVDAGVAGLEERGFGHAGKLAPRRAPQRARARARSLRRLRARARARVGELASFLPQGDEACQTPGRCAGGSMSSVPWASGARGSSCCRSRTPRARRVSSCRWRAIRRSARPNPSTARTRSRTSRGSPAST